MNEKAYAHEGVALRRIDPSTSCVSAACPRCFSRDLTWVTLSQKYSAVHLPVACGRFRLVFRDCGGHGAANKHRSTGQTAIECRTHQHPAWQRLAVSFCSCVICLPVDSNVPSWPDYSCRIRQNKQFTGQSHQHHGERNTESNQGGFMSPPGRPSWSDCGLLSHTLSWQPSARWKLTQPPH